MSPILVAVVAAAVPTIGLGAAWMRSRQQLAASEAMLRPIRDARAEASRIREQANGIRDIANQEAATARLRVELDTTQARATAELDAAAIRQGAEEVAKQMRDAALAAKNDAELRVEAAQSHLAQLAEITAASQLRSEAITGELRALEEQMEVLNVGLYRPHFTYEDSESYKEAIEGARDRQKRLVKEEKATRGSRSLTLDGDVRAGVRMVKRQEKLILRAFNADSEAAIANVSWNNYETMVARVTKAFESLNDAGGAMQTAITADYLAARLEELRLVYEAADKKKDEKERQRMQRAAQREEERVQRELAKVQAAAEKEENQFERALLKARADLEEAASDERDAMSSKIADLERQLVEAHARKERAIAQAQLTRVGHVYIISNHGAFGDGIVKIGMTRRLEPEERIQELGDASVPFPFDVHALVYSEDAPALELRLHEAFWEHRLNWANDRKEFFRISLLDLQAKLREIGLVTELQMLVEAREYRETIAAREAVRAGVARDPSRGPLPSIDALGVEPVARPPAIATTAP